VPFGLVDAAYAILSGTDEEGICGIIWVIMSIVALYGGVMAVYGKDFNTAMVGAILACLMGGPFFIGSALGIAGAVLVGVSKAEFPPQPKAVVGGEQETG
jgi:hypothetical protein